MRLGHALHGLRETLGMTIVPREELRHRRALGLLLVVALVFGGAFGLARSARSGGAAASEDRSASGTTLSIAQLGNEPTLPALLVPKPSAPAPRRAAPPTATTTTTTTTTNLGGLQTGPPVPVSSPAPSAPAPTPAPSPAPATPSKPSGGSFDDSG
ncbi:MAG: hypothetical protein QOJ55_2405 [Solirubrobacteraceae bacterium]|jgi:hypothetical protein|nr:hypothetical protein [Solirubrobacteraceae bacterium]MDX6674343.1 hypothetical protein [Solirubrobacteraceae bacterium]